MCVYVCVHMYICAHTCVNVYMCGHLDILMCMHKCMHVCIYVCKHVHMMCGRMHEHHVLYCVYVYVCW